MSGLAVLALAAVAPACAEETPIRPGYWEFTTSVMMSEGKSKRQCVPPEKIEQFLSGPANSHYRCEYPSRSVAGGHARFEGVCVGKHGSRYKVSVHGAYAATHFELDGHVSGALLGLPVTAPASIRARWLSADCPLDAKS